jgi:hypothetical protein
VRAPPYLIAITAVIVFVGTLGLLLVVGGFGVIRICEEMLEAFGVLPPRWGENNLLILVNLSIILSLPVVGWFGFWFYRRALAVEKRMVGYVTAPRTEG